MLFLYAFAWLHLDFLKQEKLLDYVEINYSIFGHECSIWPASSLIFNWCLKNKQNLLAARATSWLLILGNAASTKNYRAELPKWNMVAAEAALPKCLKILRTQIKDNTTGVELGYSMNG